MAGSPLPRYKLKKGTEIVHNVSPGFWSCIPRCTTSVKDNIVFLDSVNFVVAEIILSNHAQRMERVTSVPALSPVVARRRKAVRPVSTTPQSVIRVRPRAGGKTSREMFLRQQHGILRSQAMMLDQLSDKLEGVGKETLEIIEKVKNASFTELFTLARSQAREIGCLLQDGHCDVKLLTRLLSVMLSVSRVHYAVSYNIMITQRTIDAKPVENTPEHDSSPDDEGDIRQIQNIDANQSSFICRICEEVVPLDVITIEEHSRLCIRAHENHFHFHRYGERLKVVQQDLANFQSLQSKWPGLCDEVCDVVFPLVTLYSMLTLVIEIKITDPDARTRLETLSDKVSYFNVPAELRGEIGTVDVFRRAKMLTHGKLLAYIEIEHATRAHASRTGRPQSLSGMASFQTELYDYEFVDRISSGAFARVYLARRRRTGDNFAIKVIKKSHMSLKNQLEAVSAERDIMQRLESPYIVGFYCSFIEVHNMYMVLEYVPGGDIASVLDDLGSLPEDAVRTYATQLICALELLRENRIIHRDLKPGNVLISKDGKLKLTDFGLSYFGSEHRTATGASAQVVGTPDYMAPEVIMSGTHTYAVDYWSLGSMIFEMLCGVTPFCCESKDDTFRRIVSGQPKWQELSRAEEEISPEGRDFLGKLLIVDPEKRLGVNSIEEIKGHAWFKDIDWRTISDSPSVFVPEITGSPGENFNDRYAFAPGGENDIMEDINASKLRGDIVTSGRKVDDQGVSGFRRVSLRQYRAQNEELVHGPRRERPRSCSIGMYSPSDDLYAAAPPSSSPSLLTSMNNGTNSESSSESENVLP